MQEVRVLHPDAPIYDQTHCVKHKTNIRNPVVFHHYGVEYKHFACFKEISVFSHSYNSELAFTMFGIYLYVQHRQREREREREK